MARRSSDGLLLRAEDSGVASSGAELPSCSEELQLPDCCALHEQEVAAAAAADEDEDEDDPEDEDEREDAEGAPGQAGRRAGGGGGGAAAGAGGGGPRARRRRDADAGSCKGSTIKQHYYPEGGWGWLVLGCGLLAHLLAGGLHGAAGVLLCEAARRFPGQPFARAGWLGALSTAVALLLSPVTIAFCRRKSTRVTAVLGGLVTALGCLFTSFASQFHQLFFSYGAVIGVGVGLTRDCSTLMVAQYFKRRREFVEIFLVAGSGLGVALMSAFIHGAVSAVGWRLGLQAVTGAVFLTFFLGTFYRSASLYHPQRRAILHLKNQKRKIKDKSKTDDRPPFFDLSALRSRTVRILLFSTGLSALGLSTPLFYLAHQAEQDGLGEAAVLLQAYLGLAWALGCGAFGLVVVQNSGECRIARQYLCQAAVCMCGLSMLALTAVRGSYPGYVLFVWIYGLFCGGYHYSLKMYTYERVRARNFARTWGFVQCSQSVPLALGVPIAGYIDAGCGDKTGYYFSSACVLLGSLALFLVDVHRRRLARHKHTRANGTRHLCVSETCPQRRRPSFSQEPDVEPGALGGAGLSAAAALVLAGGGGGPCGGGLGGGSGGGGAAAAADLAGLGGAGAEVLLGAPSLLLAAAAGDKPELTCISEEGIADMDLPDNLLDDLDYIGDCITSCNKVENYLMLSEFENNLIAEMPVILDRKGRRWSLARQSPRGAAEDGVAGGCPEDAGASGSGGGGAEAGGAADPAAGAGPGRRVSRELPAFRGAASKWRLTSGPKRVITVIDEASV